MQYPPTRAHPLAAGVILLALGLAALIVWTAGYWPFVDSDAVSIYAGFGRLIFETRRLPVGEGLYEAYPMLVPLSYAYSFILGGDFNEYAARLFPALLAVGTLGAAALLGKALYGWRVGLAALMLLALAPTFARWSPSGYVDVPSAFFFTLAAWASWRLFESGSGRDAILAGILAGLAAWTKNSALTLAVSLPAWLVYARWRAGSRLDWRRLALALIAFVVVAGPWYTRNVIEFGRLVPDTVWTDKAARTLPNLVPFLRSYRDYWVSGIVLTLGLAWALVEALPVRRITQDRQDRARLLLVYALPLAAAWWWMASYENRFLLTILPLVAMMGGQAAIRAWDRVWGQRPLRPALQVGIVVLLAVLMLPAARKALIFKGEMLRAPLMSDAQRHRVGLGPVYDVALYLNALPVEGTILSDNYFLPLHARTARIVVGGLPDRATLAVYDYLVISPGKNLFAPVQPEDVTLLVEIGGFRVYRVVAALADDETTFHRRGAEGARVFVGALLAAPRHIPLPIPPENA